MFSQFVGFDNDFRWEEIECIRKEAGRRIAQMRGKIDVVEIIGEMTTSATQSTVNIPLCLTSIRNGSHVPKVNRCA